ncbi:ABC transporter ATP-binding protein [Bosea vaviloviae]|jgi:ABC-type sugar transport system ATPase subunit|uniref:Glycerol-3-phosphate transporter ATP-binding subunit n=1 Tax=Bosea vaviloviae TaxID=1526658 RepID=A0A0N0M7M8_9HYPH|nr:sn-glycerol-3-phosphate ABC transporter ATP-binding protein UgpC [Bosea vaviloviae]KPH74452.1 glycerol-3-phosphate transporter ATP-binding subunit [Bosea vaviloviae]
MAHLQLQKVGKSYGTVEVIPGIDFEINSGEFLVLVGPSGSGKSTLLKMIAGLEETTSGKIRVDGEDITHLDPSARDLAMVFQSYALYPHMTVKDNMSFALRMRGEDPTEIDRRVKDAVTMLDLGGLENRKPGQLSGGQRQRVAMGRCVVRNPKLFLFDEPLSNLDAKLRAQTRIEIRRLHERLNATSIFVTHDQVEAMTMADRIALLKDGKLQQIGSPQDLYLRPNNSFVATFIGTPEMNLLLGQVETVNGGFQLGGASGMHLPVSPERQSKLTAASLPGLQVKVGVRPEHFEIVPAGSKGALKVDVNVTEWLGHEIFIFGQSSFGPIGVRVPEGVAAVPAANDVLSVRPISDRWHVFDAASGDNLLAE